VNQTAEPSSIPRFSLKKAAAQFFQIPHLSRQEWIVIAVAFVATLAKLYCAWTTRGSNDAALFRIYGLWTLGLGLPGAYHHSLLVNHPPLVIALMSRLALYTGTDERAFNFLVRLPGIIADVGTIFIMIAMWRRFKSVPYWAMLAFAFSPISFMVTGFHGNTDPILAFFLVAAVYACVRNSPMLCGVCLGLACNVKIIPLLLTPVFFFYWLHRGNWKSFSLLAAVTVMFGFMPLALTDPYVLYRNVLSYSSYWGNWGITNLLLRTIGGDFSGLGFTDFTLPQRIVVTLLKGIIILFVLLMAWFRRKESAEELWITFSLIWLLFFSLAPGICVQYFVWFAPFLLLHSPRWWAAVTVTVSAYLFVFYTSICGGLPWNYGLSTVWQVPIWINWTYPAWITIICAFAFCSRKLLVSWRGERVKEQETSAALVQA